MRVIMVPVADRPECARALQAAFNLGKRLDASISGCHMRPHSTSKTTLGTEMLSCRTPAMVQKEIWIYLLAYNLIRLLMGPSGLIG